MATTALYGKQGPFQGLKGGSGLTLRSELPKETHVLTKQEALLGRGGQAESRRLRDEEPGNHSYYDLIEDIKYYNEISSKSQYLLLNFLTNL